MGVAVIVWAAAAGVYLLCAPEARLWVALAVLPVVLVLPLLVGASRQRWPRHGLTLGSVLAMLAVLAAALAVG